MHTNVSILSEGGECHRVDLSSVTAFAIADAQVQDQLSKSLQRAILVSHLIRLNLCLQIFPGLEIHVVKCELRSLGVALGAPHTRPPSGHRFGFGSGPESSYTKQTILALQMTEEVPYK